MDEGFAQRLSDRAGLAGIDLQAPLRDSLVTYFGLLSRWNARMNLTSLTDGDAAIDRLLLEPLVAASALPHNARLMDLGSGGGSPAIPLALAGDAVDLIMVESRERKAAFLREAARTVGLRATVETARFEDLSARGDYAASSDIVSMRAVKMDAPALDAAATFSRLAGRLALFVTAGTSVTPPPDFSQSDRRRLPGTAELVVLARAVPRGTVSAPC